MWSKGTTLISALNDLSNRTSAPDTTFIRTSYTANNKAQLGKLALKPLMVI